MKIRKRIIVPIMFFLTGFISSGVDSNLIKIQASPITTTLPDIILDVESDSSEEGLSSILIKPIDVRSELKTAYQDIESIRVVGDRVVFTHIFSAELGKKPLTYHLEAANGDVLESVSIKPLKEDDYWRTEVSFSKDSFNSEIAWRISFGVDNKRQFVQDFDQSIDKVEGNHLFQIAFQEQNLVLLSQSEVHYTYKEHQFFAESLQVDLAESDTIHKYQLLQDNANGEEFAYYREANKGISLAMLEEGRYFIQFNQRPVYVTDSVFDVWYTIHREGQVKQITLESYAGFLTIYVEEKQSTSEDDYDILVDPGHGGSDSGAVGNGTTEAKEVLKVSNYIVARLEDHGLKVKLSREDMSEPSTDATCVYQSCPYTENGRIEQVYRYKVNYVLSNHLNASDGNARGFEVYGSMATENEWASQIVSAFKEIGRTAHDVKTSPYRVSEGSYKRSYKCDFEDKCSKTYADYYYMIRESGSQLTQSRNLTRYNQTYTSLPRYGAEALLLEYIFLDNKADYQVWSLTWEAQGEAVVKATVNYLKIPYQPIETIKAEEY